MSLRLTGKNIGSFERPCRVAYSILIGNKARRTASGSPGLLPAACGRGLAESSSAGSGALSRRNSSMRARITAKSSAARGRVMSPPFSFFHLTLCAMALYRRRKKVGTRNSRAVTYFCRRLPEAGGGSAWSAEKKLRRKKEMAPPLVTKAASVRGPEQRPDSPARAHRRDSRHSSGIRQRSARR